MMLKYTEQNKEGLTILSKMDRCSLKSTFKMRENSKEDFRQGQLANGH